MISRWFKKAEEIADAQVILHLSGEKLDMARSDLEHGANQYGGVEQVINGMAAKAALIRGQLLGAAATELTLPVLLDLVAFMPTVRRRIGEVETGAVFEHLRDRLAALLENLDDPSGTDRRLADFLADFPQDRKHRWLRDLAAEVLHYCEPEIYPLMCRWVWDAKANTGALREIWHNDNGGDGYLRVADDFATFRILSDELTGYALSRGVASDPVLYGDLLLAQVYANYVKDQGSVYLKTDFSSDDVGFGYTLRMLGLDAVQDRFGRTRVKTANGGEHYFSGILSGVKYEETTCQSMKKI